MHGDVGQSNQQDLLVLLPAPLDPLLQQVLVVAVCPGPQRVDPLLAEAPTVGVDEHGHQSVQLPVQVVDPLHDLGHGGLKQQDHEDSEEPRWDGRVSKTETPALTWKRGCCVRRDSSRNSSWMLVTSATVLSDVQWGGWAVPLPMFTSE